METKDKIALLRERFVIRDDTFVVQWSNKETGKSGYWQALDGKCPHTPPCTPRRECDKVSLAPLTDRDLVRHLKGEKTVGVYQLDPDANVKWLCFDCDIFKNAMEKELIPFEEGLKRTRAQATALAQTLQNYGIDFLVEHSGRRGYHVFVFFDAPVQASKVRSIGYFILDHAEPPEHVGTEIYPKQTDNRGFGNLVKLPLGIHKKSGKRSLFVSRKFEPLDDQWAALQRVRLFKTEFIDLFMQTYDVQEVRTSHTDAEHKYTLPCFDNLFREGAQPGQQDISTYKAATFLRERGLSSEMAVGALEGWSTALGLGFDREWITQKVTSAYSSSVPSWPCNVPEMDNFCSPECRFFESRLRPPSVKRKD